MLDIKLIRERPDFVRQRLTARGAGDEAHIDEVLASDELRRKLLAEVEALKAQRKRVSKEIGALMGQKKFEEAEAKKKETGDLGDRIADLDKQAAEAESARNQLMLRLPNLPHDSVPPGTSAADNPVVRVHGEQPSFAFKPKSHVDLCESLKLVDFARAAKLSGSGFVLYTNWGARIERALIQFMLDLHTREHGYTEVSPPYMVGPQCLEGVGQFPKFADQYYAVQEGLDAGTLGKLYLIPTAETPVANSHREEILKESELPIHYCAYTPCFRGEAGAAGVGTRGIIRVHQFDKVELIRIVRPEDGYAAQEQMLADLTDLPAVLDLVRRLSPADGGTTEAMLFPLRAALALATIGGPMVVEGVKARAREWRGAPKVRHQSWERVFDEELDGLLSPG